MAGLPRAAGKAAWRYPRSLDGITRPPIGPAGGKDIANRIGPCIVTPDEFADPYTLTMTARINGEIWSHGTTASMHWRFKDAIEQFSRNAPLVPGEIIGSGTVLNGCGFELDRYLQSGDRVELEIEGIGCCGIGLGMWGSLKAKARSYGGNCASACRRANGGLTSQILPIAKRWGGGPCAAWWRGMRR
ncbi:hypothetical protein ASE00_10200 [Sphingomonas sp. Root710]|uniref:fumarylacetoacetate hydrolase family protein n=1 Tax=Sphingomonas sp. Root710 TaxID=1736594 RepID=UPI000701A46D|nr:fumarylacetoacetate hydrolase family protein [Sphingomonas sp. Root710]KRB82426.1 hypothetical protein ASE00_10200 [Sphingomonas sp. Root710]